MWAPWRLSCVRTHSRRNTLPSDERCKGPTFGNGLRAKWDLILDPPWDFGIAIVPSLTRYSTCSVLRKLRSRKYGAPPTEGGAAELKHVGMQQHYQGPAFGSSQAWGPGLGRGKSGRFGGNVTRKALHARAWAGPTSVL